MNKFIEFIEKKVAPQANKLRNQRYVQAITSTFMTLIPFMTIGSFALILISPSMDYTTMDPGFLRDFFAAWQNLADFIYGPFHAIFKGTMGSISLLTAVGVSYYLARDRKMSTYLPVALGAGTFMMVNAIDVEGSFTTAYFEGTGLFAAIVIAIVTFELYRLLYDKKVGRIEFGGVGVPPAISESFASLVPMTIVALAMGLLSAIVINVTGDVFPNLMMFVMKPLLVSVDSVWGIAFASILITLFWWFGIHDSVVMSILNPIFIANLTVNMSAYASGTAANAVPYIATRPFWFTFLTIGGSGATFALCLLCFFSKSKQIKTVGKLSLVPAFFNINEPIIFGLPVMYNPFFFIPFMGSMTANGIITFIVMSLGIIGRPIADPTWNMFAPIAALIATADVKAVVLVILLIVLDLFIYLPFFKIYEKQKMTEEAEA